MPLSVATRNDYKRIRSGSQNTNMTKRSSHSGLAKLPKQDRGAVPQEEISKLRETTLELQEENLALREEIKRLRDEKEVQEKEMPTKEAPSDLELSENVYWLLKNSERQGPFCPRCYSEHQRLSTLLDGARFVGKTRWICPVCNRVFDSEA